MKSSFYTNEETYNNPKKLIEYDIDHISELQKPEKIILSKITPFIRNKPILDLAIGGGRTTKHLLKISKNYIGIEKSNYLFNLANENFPNVRILKDDYRNLSEFKDNQFNFILISYNGLDYVNHEDRLNVLSQIKRILKPDGYFVFSSHNQKKETVKFKFIIRRNIFKAIGQNFERIKNRIKLKKYEEFNNEYSYINNSGHNYGLLTYGISYSNSITQLRKAGFHGEIFCINNRRFHCKNW